MEQNCLEQLLDDVVRVDLVLASECDMSVPFQVSGLTTMASTKTEGGATVDRIGAALLSLAYNVQDGDDGEISEPPVLKQTEKRVKAGIVVSHDLQVPVTAFFEATRIAVNLLHTKDFHVILTTHGGDRYMLYSVPNSSEVLLDEQDVNQKSTVKVSLQSMSHVIRLT
ncbi:MAG: hypothetical protein IKR31_03230 [Prevotella sp.]|nr:hypothetical protein [Prevotella sp.]